MPPSLSSPTDHVATAPAPSPARNADTTARGPATPAAAEIDQSVLVLACGALARELLHLVRLNRWGNVTVDCLPAELHNRPERIPTAVTERLRAVGGDYDRILLGYADCGTGGGLDRLCEAEGIERLPGAHCYEFFAGHGRFTALHEEALGTLYLTDYLARHFDRIIMKGLGIDAHPELRDMYFGNYTRVVHLAQSDDPDFAAETAARAAAAAAAIDLPLETIATGYGELGETAVAFVSRHAGGAAAGDGGRSAERVGGR